MSGSAFTPKHRLVIFASSLGTVFEWYDFFIFGTLAAFFGQRFFPPGDETAGYLSSLALFGVGFSMRPFGALVFGRLGDRVGRKHTFLLTIVVMGLSTALIGALPSYAAIGFWAPVLLMLLRMAQGLALGGEYGGAAIYVSEHAPAGHRATATSWIQLTSTLGFLFSLAVIYGLRARIPDRAFADWGWRLPFLLSVVLLGFSVYIRLKLEESPVFAQMKAEGRTSRGPLRESFARWANVRLVLLALFGAVAGQAVIWYCGQFYALFFLTTTLKLDYRLAYPLVGAPLALGGLLFVPCGRLADRIGRKPCILLGCLLAVSLCQPIFHGLTRAVNPALAAAARRAPVVLHVPDYRGRRALVAGALADAARRIVAPSRLAGPEDRARSFFSGRGAPFDLAPSPDGRLCISVGSVRLEGFDPKACEAALAAAGYPRAADPAAVSYVCAGALILAFMGCIALTYAPIAAFLAELFPARIRYTSLSLPYHVGNGWFGGFLPLIATSIAVFTGDIYAGLWYPMAVAALTFIVGALGLPETRGRDISV